MNYFRLLTLPLIFVSCFGGPSTPEAALKDYIDTVTQQNVTKDFYLNRTTGKLNQSIQDMDDKEFEEFKKLPSISNIKFKVITKNCDQNTCSLTYLLSFKSSSATGKAFSNEIKKVAVLEKVEDSWKVSDSSNLKTYIEANTPLKISK